jgi:hypothetical protein
VEKQPLTSLLTKMFENYKQKQLRREKPAMKLVNMNSKLQSITIEMERAGLIRKDDEDNVLWHWDLSARNILIQRQTSQANCSGSRQEQTTSTSNEPKPAAYNSTKGSRHSAQFTLQDGSDKCQKHEIHVLIEHGEEKPCKHKIEIALQDGLGETYRHTLEVTVGKEFSSQEQVTNSAEQGSGEEVEEVQQHFAEEWVISGVIDWDDALSVPLVLARTPPTWLWFDEGERTLSWSGNRDTMPERDLTNDELLIKAHFDQIMARRCPTYLEDAYHRGVWIRALARFALYGFHYGQDFERYDKFVLDWENYFQSLSVEIAKEDKVSEGEEVAE